MSRPVRQIVSPPLGHPDPGENTQQDQERILLDCLVACWKGAAEPLDGFDMRMALTYDRGGSKGKADRRQIDRTCNSRDRSWSFFEHELNPEATNGFSRQGLTTNRVELLFPEGFS